MDFNPHTREGCDLTVFISTTNNNNFNPHTREGCDGLHQIADAIVRISIHTPARGVTNNPRKIDGLILFQSTHPRGV